MCLVPSMLPKTCCLIVGSLVSLYNLVNSIIVNLNSLLLALYHWGSLGVVGKSHENTIEPNLPSVDGLVPENAFLGAWLLLELLIKSLEGCEVVLLLVQTVHAEEELSVTYIIEIKLVVVITSNILTRLVNHLLRILLQILINALVFVAKICIEHSTHLCSHSVVPTWFLCEVEHVWMGNALHLRVCHPLAVMLVRFVSISKDE